MRGSDLGAQINAADAMLGASAGTIIVSRGGTATTPVKLNPRHGLLFKAPTSWSAGITVSESNHVVCSGEKSTLTISLPNQDGFIAGIGVKDIAADNCWMHTTNPGGKNYYFVAVRSSSKISVTNCHAVDLPLLLTIWVWGSEPDMPKSLVHVLSRDVEFSGNSVTLPSQPWRGKQATGAMIVYTENVHISNNHFENMLHGVQFWGGDAHGKNVNIDSPREAGNIVIENNTCSHVWGACYWGSMAHDVKFLNNTAKDCGDVCIDAEGCADVLMSGNTVEDGHAAGLATFFFNERITITHNNVTSTSEKYPLLRTWNSSQSPDLNRDTQVSHNTFTCVDPQAICRILFESTNGFSFSDNQLLNTTVRSWNNQKNASIVHNVLTFTHAGKEAYYPIYLGGQMPGGFSRVMNNRITADHDWLQHMQCIGTADTFRYMDSGNFCGAPAH
jgi:hypothetical protein